MLHLNSNIWPGEVKLVHVFHTIAEDAKLAKLIQETIDDKEYQIIKAGREYGSVWEKLSVKYILLLVNGKMITPFKAKERILHALHIPNNGIDNIRVAARQLYYWPKMDP